jgi:hypothetical protein
VINKSSYQDFKNFTEELSQAGTFLTGGKVLTEGDFGKGYFCAPTLVADVPLDHRLWKHEMFLPITTVARVKTTWKRPCAGQRCGLRPDGRLLRQRRRTSGSSRISKPA